MDRTGIEPVTTFVTRPVQGTLEAGWLLHAGSRWLGHTKLTTTDTYLNATTRLLHDERVPLALVKN